MTDAGGDLAGEEQLRKDFLSGMAFAAATVNVVTTDGPAGRAGVTVSAMSSVSADTAKPILLVCVNERSEAASKLLENGVFCVNILRDDQTYISDTFAGRYKDRLDDKFECAAWTAQKTGAPRVVDPLVAFDCKVVDTKKIGLHHVIFGEVQDIFVASRGTPLIYHNRAYRSSALLDPTPPPDFSREAEGNAHDALSVGCFHTFGPFLAPRLIREMAVRAPATAISLIEGENQRILTALGAGEIDLGLLYSFGIDERFEAIALTELEPYVMLPEGHPLEVHSELTPDLLADYPMVGASEGLSSDFLERVVSVDGAKPHVAFRSSSFEMVRGMVGNGFGYAVAMTKPASAVTYDGLPLVIRRLSAPVEAGGVSLAWRKDHPLSSPAEIFKACCLDQFAVS
ncbi:MAG: LysR substrate-binding domain-containing protein [Pseudomonadota bacterium]